MNNGKSAFDGHRAEHSQQSVLATSLLIVKILGHVRALNHGLTY